MVDFVQLQEIVKEHLERDKAVESVEAVGPTLETAVSDAAALLDIPVRRMEYEVLERGSAGFMGMGKKDWRIQAYEHLTAAKKKHTEDHFEEEAGIDLPVIENKDGEAFVQLKSGGDALLKVTPPSGNGKKVTDTYVMQILAERRAANIDTAMVGKVIDEALGAYVKVGIFEPKSYNDSVMSVEIADGEMQAFITVKAPGEGGCDLSYDSYISTIKNNFVVYGIKEEFLRNFIDQPVYGEKVLAAEGSKNQDGRNAYIQYNFEVDQGRARLKEGSNGKVDFKELNIIQNVVQNQPLAKKIPPEKGIPGKTVKGNEIPTKDGVDISLPVGKNVHVADDGATILADVNGQVVVVSGLINVEPVYTIDGDVSVKTGNVVFLGTVIVTGNVEDGFLVKAAGNIEVNGTVGKAELDAEGDIIIHQGINSKGGGRIHAGKSIWARFIQNANIDAGSMVVASDGIINSQVDAVSRIICQGKRASIMGGRLRARDEINAKVLGNPTSGTETICEVGFDPRSKAELDRLLALKVSIEKQIEDIKPNIQTLSNQKQQRKTLPEDKEEVLEQLTDKKNSLETELEKTEGAIAKINDYLANLKAMGRISASSKVFPGVKLIIRDARDEVHSEYKAVTYTLENGLIKPGKYEEPNEEIMKGPDGYSTN